MVLMAHLSSSHLIIGEAVSHGGEELAQPILGDDAGVLLVKAAEGVLDDLLGVGTLQPLAEQRQEHGEVDGARRLAHHALQVVVGGVLACGSGDGAVLQLLADT